VFGADGVRRRRGGLGLEEAGVVRGHQGVEVPAQVVPQVPSVRYLPGIGCTLSGAVGVAASPVPADRLHSGVGTQPLGEVPGLPAVEDVHRPIPVAEVNQHRPVFTAASPREFVHAKDGHRPDGRVR
jgi:hypothetical protein